MNDGRQRTGIRGLRDVVPPDGLLAAVLVALLTTAGIYYVNIMAALVDGLRAGLQLSERDAGLIGAANVYGAASGALAAAFIAARLPWRRAAALLLCLLMAIDFGCALLREAPLLIAARFLDGLVGGLLVGIGVMVIARTRVPDRGFGMLLLVQFALGGLGIMFLPGLARSLGTWVLFGALIAMSGLTLLVLPWIPDYPAPAPAPTPGAASFALRPMLLTALVAIFMFQAFAMSTSAYSIGMGVNFGLSPAFVSMTLGLGTWVGLLGSGAVVFLGVRLGRFWPIVLGILIDAACNLVLIYAGSDPWIWAIANAIGSIAWSFVLPYLYGLVSAFDAGGRTAPWAGFFSKLGLASGPAAGAFILAETHFTRLLWWSALAGVLAAALAAGAARRLDRSICRGIQAYET